MRSLIVFTRSLPAEINEWDVKKNSLFFAQIL